MNYGYARVSTGGQSVDAQVKRLRAAGTGKVFRETASGARAGRANCAALSGSLRRATCLWLRDLIVWRARPATFSTRLRQSLTRAQAFVPLPTHGRTPRPRTGRLMLTMLGGLAEFERDLIRARTTEGRERAKADGAKMGRPSKLTAHQKKEAIHRRNHGDETLAEIGRSYNVSAATISRLS